MDKIRTTRIFSVILTYFISKTLTKWQFTPKRACYLRKSIQIRLTFKLVLRHTFIHG